MVRFAAPATALLAALAVPATAQTLEEAAIATEGLDTLESLLILAGLAPNGPLNDPAQNFTVFAPLDTAFAALGEDLLAKYQSEPWRAHLTDILLFHVLGGAAVTSAQLADGENVVTMLNGENVTVTKSDTGVTVSYPAGDDFGTANVAQADVIATNGVAHVVDGVLLPKHVSTPITTAAATGDFGDDYTTIASLVAGALGSLGDVDLGDLTVLAPTNAAFEALGDALTQIQCDANSQVLMGVLTLHVMSGVYPSMAVPDGAEVSLVTLAGSNLTAANNGGGITFTATNSNTAAVVDADLLFADGVVHGIDQVLLPADFALNDCGTTDGTDDPMPPMDGTDAPVDATMAPGVTDSATEDEEASPTASPGASGDEGGDGAEPTTSPGASADSSPSPTEDSSDDSSAPMFGFSIMALGAAAVAALL